MGLTKPSLKNASVVGISDPEMKSILGDYAISIVGDGSTYKYFEQDIPELYDSKGIYVIGGWAKADAVPHTVKLNKNGAAVTDGRFFGLELELIFQDYEEDYQWPEYYRFPFNPAIDGGQYQIFIFQVPTDRGYVLEGKIRGIYKGEGTAYFDNIQFYRDELGTATRYSYNDRGLLVKIFDTAGKTIEYGYDNNDDIISLTANGITTYIERLPNTLINNIRRNNVKISFGYDGVTKQITSTTFGELSDKWFKTTTSYIHNKQYIHQVKDEFGNIITYNTDRETSLISEIIDALGNKQIFQYDEYGNITGVENEDEKTAEKIDTIYKYDGLGRLQYIEQDGFSYEFVYDDLDRIQSVKIKDQTYDLVDYVYLEKAINGVTYYTDLIKDQIYGNGDIVSFVYDEESRVKRVKFNGAVWFEYEYDSSERLTILKDIKNNNIYFYSYDYTGRIQAITDKDGNEITYVYDSLGNVYNYNYTINGTNRGVLYIYNLETGEYDYVQYYLTGGTVVKKDYQYQNDALKRLDYIDLIFASTKLTKKFEYDDNKVNPDMGNATTRIYTVSYLKNGVLQKKYVYTYDANQNITSIVVQNASGATIERYDYKYDGFNQLIREDYFDGTISYTKLFSYDGNGNIESIKKYEYTTSEEITTQLLEKQWFLYENAWKDQITKIEYYIGDVPQYSQEFTYDNSGNVISITDSRSSNKSFSWKGRSLVGIGDDISYKYNDQGIRTEKRVNGIITEYYLDGSKVLYERSKNESTGQISDTIYYTYDVDGSLISMNLNGTEYFYITNLQGDIIELVDINGNTVVQYKYDAWGKILGIYDTSSISLSAKNPYRYRGYRYDEETGWYYLQSRYYNPEIGRFINADGLIGPVGDILGHNMYAYTQNNPVMMVDPDGEFAIITFLICVGVGMLAGGTIGGITAYSNDQDVLSGVVTGALIGGAVGAVVGLGSGAILAGLKSVGTKFVSDLTAYITFGKEFGKWEDYAIAFSFGGLTKGLNFGNTEKFIADVFIRPATVQLSKMGTRGKSLSIEKYSYDVISRSITFGMPTDLKPIARGLFSGYYDSLKSNNQYLLSYDNFI